MGDEPEAAQEPHKPTRAASARKPSIFARAGEAIRAPFSRLRLPTLDWRTVSYGLLALIALILIVRNWAPVRISLFGWYVDIPKAIAFIIFFGLGVLAAWLWELRAQRLGRTAAQGPAETEQQTVDEQDVAV